MLSSLVFGFPDQRPGGLMLTLLMAVAAAGGAAGLGMIYAAICVRAPRLSLGLQGVLAVLRGVPLLLLVFFIAQVTPLPITLAGFTALILYSLSHVGETLRSFLAAYPAVLREQARLLTIWAPREWVCLRLPWTIRTSLESLATHWISLLKDTGALMILGIGELTTVTRVLSERTGTSEWLQILGLAALLYLTTVIALIKVLQRLRIRYSVRGDATR